MVGVHSGLPIQLSPKLSASKFACPVRPVGVSLPERRTPSASESPAADAISPVRVANYEAVGGRVEASA